MTHYTKKFLLIVFIFLFSIACKQETQSNKISIITTLFPQYNFAKIVAQDKANVSLLLPAGVEVHGFEPTPKDIVKIQNCSLFIYTGEIMEPWADKIIETTKHDKFTSLDLSKNIVLQKNNNLEHAEHDHDGEMHHKDEKEADEDLHETHHNHHHGDFDPHFWLSPLNAIIMTQDIANALSKIDPENKSFYQKNASNYIIELKALHASFINLFKHTKHKTIVQAGHFAFGYFESVYGLKHISPYKGFSPDSEPTAKRIVDISNTLKNLKINAIFYEELTDPKIARIIAKQTGAKFYLLHAAHNVSKNELKNGTSYLEIMKNNLENLKIGLEYTK